MKYISGKDRRQIEIFSLEQVIDQNNEVRLIDLFVGGLVLADFGFKTHSLGNFTAFSTTTVDYQL